MISTNICPNDTYHYCLLLITILHLHIYFYLLHSWLINVLHQEVVKGATGTRKNIDNGHPGSNIH